MLNLQESFNNLAVIVNAALMNKQERVAIDESLNNIVQALQAYDVLKKQVKEFERKSAKDKEKVEKKKEKNNAEA